MPGRSCFRATPAWSTRSRREDGGWDALRFVSLTEATEPEHCRRVQIVVGKLPGLPGDRTGRTVLGVGPRPAAQWSLRSGHGSAEPWVEIPGSAGCGNVGSPFTNRGSWHRGVCLHHGTCGLMRWMIGCSTIAFTPAPMWQVLLLGNHALAGVIPGRSRRSLSSRCRCLSALGVTTTDAAAASLAPSATAGTDR